MSPKLPSKKQSNYCSLVILVKRVTGPSDVPDHTDFTISHRSQVTHSNDVITLHIKHLFLAESSLNEMFDFAQRSGIVNRTPKVSYTKAVDIWMTFCLFMVRNYLCFGLWNNVFVNITSGEDGATFSSNTMKNTNLATKTHLPIRYFQVNGTQW